MLRIAVLCLCGIVLLALLGVVSRPATAQMLDLSGDCTDETIRLRLQVFEPADPPPEMVGFDIVRRTLGTCGSSVVITEEPIPRSIIPIDMFIDDPGRDSNLMYEYWVYPVNGARERLDAFDIFPGFSASGSIEYVSCGLAPFAHGTVSGPGFTATLESRCESSCMGVNGYYIETWPPEAEEYLDSGVDVMIFGTVACEYGFFEGCLMYAEQVVPVTCVVATAPRSWSSLKADYR